MRKTGAETQIPLKPSPAMSIEPFSASSEGEQLASKLPSADTTAATCIERRNPNRSISPPPNVASTAVGTENNAIASPSSAGLADKSRPIFARKGTMIPTVIMDSSAGR